MRVIATTVALTMLAAAAMAEQGGQDEEQGDGTKIPGGFTSGRDYVDMPGRSKSAYVSGLMDGMILAPAFGGDVGRMKWFLACTETVGVGEMRDAINEYMFAHSDEWKSRNPAKFYRAIAGRCREHFENQKSAQEQENVREEAE